MTHEDEDTIEGVEKLLIPLIGFLKEELMFAQIATLLELAFIQSFQGLAEIHQGRQKCFGFDVQR